ncbi:IclR family transcriptional regulator [Streptomyces sp. NPDC059637]
MALVDSTQPVTGTPEKGPLPLSMVERMTLIIDAFERRSSRLTLEEVACRTGLPRSTAHRILDQLVRCQWLNHTPYGYGLGRRVLGPEGQDGLQTEIRTAAAPLLHELHLRTNMVVHLAVLDGAEVVYLDKVGGRFASGLPSRVGGRALAHATGVGKAILARLEPERVDELLPARLPRSTGRTIGDLATLRQELDRIRRRHGLAFERGEASAGVACVAAALRGPEGPVAALSLCGDERTAPLERVAPLVVDAAREASRILFPDAGTARRPRRAPQPPGRTWSPETMVRLVSAGHDDTWM